MQGYRAMRADPDAVEYSPDDFIEKTKLPAKVDLRPLMTAVENQGQTSSCVANAVAGAYEYWFRRLHDENYDVSRLFVYYNARWKAGDQNEDGGSYIQLAMKGLGDFGACAETTWPFQKELLIQKPNRDAYQEASQLRVQKMAQMPLDLQKWKQALASGLPIVFGVALFETFDDCGKRGGVVPMPSPQDVGRGAHGKHAMCCVGYSDVDEVFIVRNSWGSDWGEDGYCYMPYNYLINPKFNDNDCWVFVPDELPDPQVNWVNDDTPVVNRGRGVDFVINTFAVAAYSLIAIDLWETFTVDYTENMDEEYISYSAAVESESWEEIEEFTVEEVIEEYSEEEEISEEETEEETEEEQGEDSEEEDDSEEEEEDDSEEEEEEDSEEEEEDDSEEEEEDDSEEEEEDDSEEEEEDDSEEEEEDDSEEEEEDDSEEEEEDDSEEEEEDDSEEEEEDDSEEEEEDDSEEEEEDDSEEEEEDDSEEEEEDDSEEDAGDEGGDDE